MTPFGQALQPFPPTVNLSVELLTVMLLETIFTVPLLGENSVACGGCCPVPAEAVLLPELEQVPGVRDAEADWVSAEVRVRHAPDLNPSVLAGVLAELSYPASGWRTGPPPSE